MDPLRIFMADDHDDQIAEARKALEQMSHQVTTTASFDEALDYAKHSSFDVAVIDLAWGSNDSAGWAILDAVKDRDENTERILYSAQSESRLIIQAAEAKGITRIPKEYSPSGRRHFADVMTGIVRHLSIEKDLRKEINGLKTELEKARTQVQELQKYKSQVEGSELKFRRILLIAVTMPSVAFVLFIATWLLTQQLAVAVMAFLGGAFLVLAVFLASGEVSRAAVKELGTLLQSLFRSS
jgi:CheY-like chemotaxis protein